MKQWKIIPIMFLLLIPIVIAATINTCEEKIAPGKECRMLTPVLNCWGNYTIINKSSVTGQVVASANMSLLNDSIYYLNFSQPKGDYIVRLCDNSTREMIVRGEDNMASLAITFFLVGLISTLVILPFKVKFHQSTILNNVLKNCCWMVALFLISLTTTIVASIAVNAGIEVSEEIYTVLFIVNWACYLFMVFLVLGFFFSTIHTLVDNGRKHRFGLDEMNEEMRRGGLL